MRTVAAILVQQNSPVIVDELKIDDPLLPGQVLVEVLETGFCSTQLRELFGRNGPDPYLPHLFGHEGIGIVRELADKSSPLAVGDKVIMHWRPNQGRTAQGYRYRWGNQQVNSGPISTFSQYSVLSESRLSAVSHIPRIPARATIGCSISTGWGIANREVKLKSHDEILILGLGPTGLSVYLGLDQGLGLSTHVVEPSGQKRELLEGKTVECFPDLTELPISQRFDVVIDCSGRYDDWTNGLTLLKNDGVFIKSGMSARGSEFIISANDLLRGITISGSNGGSFDPHEDMSALLSHIDAQIENYQLFPVKHFELSEINQAVDFLGQEGAFKAVLNPWK